MPFFQNQGTFFDFQKWQEGPSPLPTSGALGSFWILYAETATRGVLLKKVLPTTLSKKDFITHVFLLILRIF